MNNVAKSLSSRCNCFDGPTKLLDLYLAKLLDILLGVQISSVRFPKDSSSYCEWFIVTADWRFQRLNIC